MIPDHVSKPVEKLWIRSARPNREEVRVSALEALRTHEAKEHDRKSPDAECCRQAVQGFDHLEELARGPRRLPFVRYTTVNLRPVR